MIAEIKPTADLVGRNREYSKAASYVTRLDKLPLGRVVNDKKVSDHHAIIPTKSEHDLGKMGDDELKIYDLVAKRFLSVFHPEAVYERTRIETTVEERVFRTSGRVLLQAGWKEVYGELGRDSEGSEDDSGGDQTLPAVGAGGGGRDALRRGPGEGDPASAALHGGVPPRGDGDGGQGHLGRRPPRGDEGLGDRHAGNPRVHHRAADPGRLHRSRGPGAARHREGDPGDLAPRKPPTDLAGAHRGLGAPARPDRARRATRRQAFMSDIVKFTADTVQELDKLKEVKIERANLGPCPVCGRDVIENRKGYSCWSKDDPGCGFVIWKKKAGKILPVSVVKELMATGKTEKPVTGFKGRSGRSFKAKLKLEQGEEGKWRVEFDEDWATQPREDEAEREVTATAAGE